MFGIYSYFTRGGADLFGLLSRSPDSKENQLSRANEHLASGQYEEAEKEFRNINSVIAK